MAPPVPAGRLGPRAGSRGVVPSDGEPGRLDERGKAIESLCDESVARLRDALPDADITCVLRTAADTLRMVAHRGNLRIIYEFPRHLGGVIWRAADRDETQVVADVASDPDYIAVDTSVRSEIAAPVRAGGAVIGVMNVESAARDFTEEDVRVVEEESARLGGALESLYES
jgi:putative methionine-R-sulfoxide reductase with GAF domain